TLHEDAVAVGPERVDLASTVDRRDGKDAVVPRAERPVVDLEVVPGDDWGHTGGIAHGADRLPDPVEVLRARLPLGEVVVAAVRRLEDRVQGELAGRVAPSDDVAELVARERTKHLSGGNLRVVDQRAVLRVGLTAVHGDAQLDVADGD